MKNVLRDLVMHLIKLLDVVLVTTVYGLVWWNFYANHMPGSTGHLEKVAYIVAFLVLFTMFGRTYDAFRISMHRIREIVYSQILSAALTHIMLFVLCWFMMNRFPPVLPLVLAFGAQIIIILLWSWFATKWYFILYPAKRTVVIYDVRQGIEYLVKEYRMTRKFDIVDIVSVKECLDGDLHVLDNAEVAFLSGVHSHDRNIILKHCVANNIVTYVIPRVGDVIMSGAHRVHMFHLPMLRVGRYHPSPEYRIIKRAFDIVSSGLVLLIASPIMLVTAIAIKVTDGGPVFYKQRRLTKDGRVFEVLKFRSMRVDAEKDGVARLSSGDNDDRITPVGRFIRKVRLDELPQLINILQGSMSVVGPRPERPEIAAEYEKELPEFRLRLQAKAGLTGYAQVYGKYNTTPYDKLQMDLMYISKPSLAEDLRIIFSTIKILFQSESTEGVAEGQITAAETPDTGDGHDVDQEA